MDTALTELAETIALRLDDVLISSEIRNGELSVTVPVARLDAFIDDLRNHPTCRFTTLVDITAIDWPTRERRFDVVYHFLSMHLNQRIRVRAEVREDEIVPSITGVFQLASP